MTYIGILMGILTLSSASQAGERLCGVRAADEVVVDFKAKQANVKSVGRAVIAGSGRVSVTFLSKGSGVTLSPSKGHWNLDRFVAIAVDVRNTGKGPATVKGALNDSGWNTSFLHVPAGESDTMLLYLLRRRKNSDYPFADIFTGMNGMPGGFVSHWASIDPKAVKAISITDLDGASVGQSIVITGVRGIGQYGKLAGRSKDTFFPFVDRFGQFKHETWPGKVTSVDDLKRRIAVEDVDLRKNPSPKDRSRFGGWAKGPRLKATGHFRTEKCKGKWWLVDPEGYLFWSHGITGVHFRSATQVGERRHYFETIPRAFLNKQKIDFAKANLAAKYGGEWEATTRDLSHQRLKSWGMNTIANWSDPTICAMQKTPYTVAVHYGGWGDSLEDLLKKPDKFRTILRQRLAKEKATTAEDPWCIGYFVDNEIKWKKGMDADLYYKVVSEEVKRAAPSKLYLGSRLHGQEFPHGSKPQYAAAAAKYCDVLSINRYRFSPSDLMMVKGADLPIIIGEFHFGALDRGMIHTGLRGVASQKQRAYAYEHYVEQALEHPHIVGTHWFQFREQNITGRADGENYQIGFVDICDTPYQEIIGAARRIGAKMYPLRSAEK
jgi:hypothetical protein